jgi:2-polyprenyl-6-methoxyphenol hydroxylase-like FAD-dependent oxidoreductase
VKVLVVGGGIGGLATTLALRQGGIDVEVVEKNPAWDVYGVGIIQPGNALRALDLLGLADACVERGHPIRGDRTTLADGVTVLAEHDWPPASEKLPPGNGLPRPILHEILTSSTLDAGVEVRTGVTCAAIAQRQEGVDVEFSDGTGGTYDLVVGADGLYSQTRAAAFGQGIDPSFTGQVCWRYNLPLLPGLDRIWVFVGPQANAGLVPLGADLMYIFTIESPAPGQADRISELGPAAVYRERLGGFSGAIGELRELIAADNAVVLRSIDAVLVPAPWHRGRVVLVGDAAHGMTPHCGQGAAQAVEDGIVLAEELGRGDGVEAALEVYGKRRFARCRAIAEGSASIGRWEQDRSLPIDPDAVRHEVAAVASRPL